MRAISPPPVTSTPFSATWPNSLPVSKSIVGTLSPSAIFHSCCFAASRESKRSSKRSAALLPSKKSIKASAKCKTASSSGVARRKPKRLLAIFGAICPLHQVAHPLRVLHFRRRTPQLHPKPPTQIPSTAMQAFAPDCVPAHRIVTPVRVHGKKGRMT